MEKKDEPTPMRIKENPERWRHLKNILADALERTSPEERVAFLRHSCGDDMELLREAQKLLANAVGVFEEFAEHARTHLRQDEHSRIGERIGAYAIVRELGRGGMGAVYVGERADGQFDKRVAIKVLKRGTDTDEVLRRFRNERQILARLEHPNITRILDAGITTDGLPYFVMELVEGTPITRFVQQQNIDLRGRLHLFLKICSAVGLAHRNHIIHRDIKPANVVVNDDGEPKLLDFGIAKLLSYGSADVTTTRAAERRLTPAYAAPEQVAAQPATTATDVYSLGVLLYELLTDNVPHGGSNLLLSGDAPPRQLTEPEPSSEVVTDLQMKHALRAELDRIVLRAMRPDPGQRYASVIALSEDVERYLQRIARHTQRDVAQISAGSVDRVASARDANHSGWAAIFRWSMAAILLGVVGLVAAILSVEQAFQWLKKKEAGSLVSATARGTVPKQTRSIAVLPFENLSGNKEDAYFADGLQGDVLTHLANMDDLRVISARSVMSYRGRAINVCEIGKTLGVSAVLEGSVRRVGNRVRVSVHLIDAENDDDLWAKNYDRDLTDVLAIQSDLAQQIASELQIKLSPAQEARMEHKPTVNSAAYLAFVQARNLQTTYYDDFEKLKQSEQLYQQAIDLDPTFALAFARYSQLQSRIVDKFDPGSARRQKARDLAERALKLQPDLPEGHLALGFSYYYGDNNYDAALTEFEIAHRGLANEAEAYLALGKILRRRGKWAESTANLEKAASLDPENVWVLQNLAFGYQMLRNFDAANNTVDRALTIDPDALALWNIKVRLAIDEKGDLSGAEKALAVVNSISTSAEQSIRIAGARAKVLLLQRKYRELLLEAENIPDALFATMPGALADKYNAIGFARKELRDEAGAQGAFLKAKSIVEAHLKHRPDDADGHAHLATLLAWLGDKEAALAEAQRATELCPESKDAVGGPEITAKVAKVYAILGNSARAIEILDGLLSRPGSVTVQGLKSNPFWDRLRNDPRFDALLDKYSNKT